MTKLLNVEVVIKVTTNKGEETMSYSIHESETLEDFLHRLADELNSMTEDC